MSEKKTTRMAGDNRRTFLKKTSVAAATVAATGFIKTPVYGQDKAPSANVQGANEKIVVGFIGVGGQGMAHVRSMSGKAGENNVACAATCDVWGKRTAAAKAHIEKTLPGSKVDEYDDYRKLLERKDIDAVCSATVDHWHTRTSVDAMNAGKHVYVEKPMTRYLGEGFEIHDTVKKTGKKLQVGSQGCSAAAWHKCAEMVRAGKIGQLVWGQGFYNRNNPKGEWNYPIDPDATAQSVNWERWMGPVHKKIPFNADHYFRWRKYLPYCGGLLGDLIPHRLHPLMLATGNPEFPTRVCSVGTKHILTDKNTPGTYIRDVNEHVEILAEFPSGLTLVVTASTVNDSSPGFVLYTNKATLNIGNLGERIEIIPQRAYSEELEKESLTGLTPTEDIGAHEKNWFDCIRNGKEPNANIDLAVRVQTVISLAEMSERLSLMCSFDAKTRKIYSGEGEYKREVAAITYGTLPLS